VIRSARCCDTASRERARSMRLPSSVRDSGDAAVPPIFRAPRRFRSLPLRAVILSESLAHRGGGEVSNGRHLQTSSLAPTIYELSRIGVSIAVPRSGAIRRRCCTREDSTRDEPGESVVPGLWGTTRARRARARGTRPRFHGMKLEGGGWARPRRRREELEERPPFVFPAKQGSCHFLRRASKSDIL